MPLLPFLLPLLSKTGLSTGARQLIARLITAASLAIGLLLLAIAVKATFSSWLSRHDADVIRIYELETSLQAEKDRRRANEEAQDNEAAGDAAINQNRKEFDDEIAEMDDEGLSDLDVADVCAELRQYGGDTSLCP